MHGSWQRWCLAASLGVLLAACNSTPKCVGDDEYLQAVDRHRLDLPANVTASERMAPLVIPPYTPAADVPEPIKKAIADADRTDADRALDAGRKPGEVFAFFKIAEGQKIGELKGDWKGWNFKFLDARGQELGLITKKWGGVGRELFTTADNYMVALDDKAPAQPNQAPMMLAAGLAIDVVFKEAA